MRGVGTPPVTPATPPVTPATPSVTKTDVGTPNSTIFKFREATVDFGDPSHSSSCQEAACTTRSRTLMSRYPPPRWSRDRIRDQAKSHRRCPANHPMDLKRRWSMDLDVLCPLEWVAGVSPTHGLPEAIIVVGDVDKAAVQRRKIFEPVRGENGNTTRL